MNIDEFSYDLPDALIATHPPKTRGQARLLCLNKKTGVIRHREYKDIVEELVPGDLVILNNTKVIKARLPVEDSNGKKREFLLLERHSHEVDTHHWKILYRRKISTGETYMIKGSAIVVEEVLDGGIAIISSKNDLMRLSEKYGTVPLPPYMKREATKEDIQRYQTEFAQEAGSVAAPTASLNFTDEIKRLLKEKGVKVAYLTLHVGLGTFLPIRTENLEDHVMHSEYYEIPKETVEFITQTKQANGRIIGIGTTVTRTLEYAYKDILDGSPKNLSGEADIFIYPGYTFRLVNCILTNFHAPRTTVLMLTAAFGGWGNLKAAYEAAVDDHYSFLSYGDSMFIH